MPARRADADQRRFLDQFDKVRVSRFRALGVIDPAKRYATIPWPSGKQKLLRVGHTRLKHGGGYSYFVCPGCEKLTTVLYDIADAPRCCRCCDAMNIRHRSGYGFGRQARRDAADQRLDELIAKVQAKERLRLKPYHPALGGRRAILVGSQRLTERMRRRMVTLRLNQLASQQNAGQVKAYQPIAATKQLVNIPAIWKCRTPETLSRALDKSQALIIEALNHPDPTKRANAATLMLRTKEARQRGL